MADWVQELSDRAEQGLKIVDKATLDKDLSMRLKYHLGETAINALFTGKGSSVTKIVTVCLVGIITISLLIKFLIEGNASGIRVVDLLLGPGMLTGSYAAGKTVQKVAEKKYGNGNGKSYRPQYRDITKNVGDNSDHRPSDTKRDHPGR